MQTRLERNIVVGRETVDVGGTIDEELPAEGWGVIRHIVNGDDRKTIVIEISSTGEGDEDRARARVDRLTEEVKEHRTGPGEVIFEACPVKRVEETAQLVLRGVYEVTSEIAN